MNVEDDFILLNSEHFKKDTPQNILEETRAQASPSVTLSLRLKDIEAHIVFPLR